MSNSVNIRNKKAGFEYFLLEEFTAGIQLTGTEIKSIRAGKASINDAYCNVIGSELFVINMHIAEYEHGSYNNHEPKRDRKLLLNRREIRKITIKINERGFTVIPVLLFLNEKGLAKLKIAIAKGKKMYDKRQTLKTKDQRREMERDEKD
ncbi:MAG: SsrA-binding protein SmpB [Bacteroidales bacterium]|nr:SsrA-binding protein SmpB [Bacteroidales bacterium]MDZ4204754.1 SsrA-binding protein SmpB [Bacteroidales bacterium]